MPIRASEKARYPKNWKAISARIRERDGNRCKECGVPSGLVIARKKDGSAWLPWQEFDSMVPPEVKESDWRPRFVKIVLTVAHLDHQPENCADENLRALCQLHHLWLDATHHQRNAAVTRRSRKAAGELFQ